MYCWRAVVQQGLAAVWAEGPGGGHFEHIRGNFSQVGCGIFVRNDEVTVVRAFRWGTRGTSGSRRADEGASEVLFDGDHPLGVSMPSP
jgi:hypothetical protein